MSGGADIVVLLGSPNEDDGTLSPIAVARCARAAEVWRERPGSRLVLTGGFGEHFNRTASPHAHYLRRQLVQREGVPARAIHALVESANTAEDAALTRAALDGASFARLTIVTSDFHAERARLLFERTFPDACIEVVAADTPVPAEERAGLEAHERRALARLRSGPA